LKSGGKWDELAEWFFLARSHTAFDKYVDSVAFGSSQQPFCKNGDRCEGSEIHLCFARLVACLGSSAA
jgi:hypothetical protein